MPDLRQLGQGRFEGGDGTQGPGVSRTRSASSVTVSRPSAAFLAVPQFLPQLARVRRAGTMAGVPWSRAALKRPVVLVTVWAVVLLTAAAVFGRAGLGSLIVLGATGVVADRLSRTVLTPGRFSRGPPLRWQRLLTGVGAC